jgi:predicted Zn-dependent protease
MRRLANITVLFALLAALTVDNAGQTRVTRTKRSSAAAKQTKEIYLVPLGQTPSLDLDELALSYKLSLGLTVKTLQGFEVDQSVVDTRRRQLVAEDLVGFVRRALPKLAGNPRVILIGVTEHDMFIRKYPWQFAFSYREPGQVAVISAARMNPVSFRQPANSELLHTRLRKMITKNIGIMYYGLPQNDNPRSVLYRRILGLEELDRAGEDF